MRGARKGANSSTSDGDALHGSMQDVQAPKMYGSKKILSYSLVIAREDPDTYKEAEVSPERDRWV